MVYVDGEEKGSIMSGESGEAEAGEATGPVKGGEERRRIHCVTVGWKSPPWAEYADR